CGVEGLAYAWRALVRGWDPRVSPALEALAAGRPVVATRVGGTREVVPDPAVGRVVVPADPWAIARALRDVISHPPSPEACRRAAEPHGIDVQAAKVLDILLRA